MRNKLLIFSALLVLPLGLYFSVAYLKQFQGPYFYGTNADPDYVYLLNSLNIARLKLPGHIDHPGTPVQVVGAITLRLTHFFAGKGKIVDDVLARPEVYLQTINAAFLWLNVVVLFFTGWSVWQISRKIEMAMLFQLAPFLTVIPEQLLKVSTEPILVIDCLLFAALVCRIFIKEDLAEKKDKYLLAFALLSALGMATKITFFPLLIIPFVLLKSWADKLYFSIVFGLAFCIFAFPLIFQWQYFRDWLKGLFFGSGVYGSGKQTVIDPNVFFQNFIKIISSEFAFDVVFLGLIALLFGFFFSNPLKIYRQNHPIRFQIVGLSVLIFGIYLIIVAKHYHYRYMIPPIVFSSVGLLAILTLLREVYPKMKAKKLWKGSFIFVFIGIAGFNQLYSYQKTLKDLRYHLYEQKELVTYINKNYPSGFKIYSYGSSCPEQAFSLALTYCYQEQSTYVRALQSIYPNNCFFSYWDKKFYRWTPSNYVNIEEVLKDKPEVYLHVSTFADNGIALNNKLPILDITTGQPTGKHLYIKDLHPKNYRETIYKVEKIGE